MATLVVTPSKEEVLRKTEIALDTLPDKDSGALPNGLPARPPSPMWGRIDNRDGTTPVTVGEPYKIAEHILWAPRRLRVGCIGAGAAGLMLCYKKEKEFGSDMDLIVYERYDSVGGVWAANKYPGCRCDIPSAGYQFSFAPNPNWPQYYSSTDEIHKYYCNFAEEHGYLGKYIQLRHEVTQAVWIEDRTVWKLFITKTLPSGETADFEDEVDFLIGNMGILTNWKWPDIPKRDTFRGKVTHSANYDTSLDLAVRRVAIIGSGASALQIVPAVQKVAREVVSVYRTPNYILGPGGLPMEGYGDGMGRNFSFTEEQMKSFREDPRRYLEFRKKVENTINRNFPGFLVDHPMNKMGHQIFQGYMREKLKHNPDLMKKLIPDFSFNCRRPAPAEGFLDAMLAPNMTLADGEITSFTPNGMKSSTGQEYEVDIIICATGFDHSFRPHFPIVGRGGMSLRETFTPQPEAYLALAVHGFPNFLMGSLGPNCPVAAGSFITVIEAACTYVLKMIRKVQTENIMTIDVRREVVTEYNEHTQQWLKRTAWMSGCRSIYNESNPKAEKLKAQYAGSLVHWWEMLREPRYEDYDITYRSSNRFQFMGNGFTLAEVDNEDLAYYLDEEYVEGKILSH